ncbi:Gfo/Idh/MocA family protein [Chloroflexota bacterium]
MNQPVTKKRVAVIGLGKMGLLHASIINALPGAEVVALCESKGIVRRFARKMFGNTGIVSKVSELSDYRLDAVYVTTPPSSHFPIIKQIYSDNITGNIFVEKPLAGNHDQAEEICRITEYSKGINMVGYQKRFAVTYRKAKEILDQGEIGEAISFKSHAYSSDFYDVKRGSKQPGARGGVLRDSGCHAIDLALWFFGELDIESAELNSIISENSTDSAYIRVRTAQGMYGDFDVSWCMDNYRLPEIMLYIKGSRGEIKVNEDKVELILNNGKPSTWYRHDLSDSVPFLIGEPEYCREDEFFINAITAGPGSACNFYTAARVDELITQAEIKAGRA